MTNENFAKKIKDIRARQDMTIEDLAERSGVKLEVLQAMEAGEVIPSLTPLTKMARALGVRLGTFLDDTPELGPVVTRNGVTENSLYFSGREDVTNATNLEFHSLGAGKIDRNIDPFLIDIEFEEGEIEVIYGKDSFIIGKGDTIFYDSAVPHHLHASGEDKAKILAVLYTPY